MFEEYVGVDWDQHKTRLLSVTEHHLFLRVSLLDDFGGVKTTLHCKCFFQMIEITVVQLSFSHQQQEYIDTFYFSWNFQNDPQLFFIVWLGYKCSSDNSWSVNGLRPFVWIHSTIAFLSYVWPSWAKTGFLNNSNVIGQSNESPLWLMHEKKIDQPKPDTK